MIYSSRSLTRWKFRHSVVVIIGILFNLGFAVPMLLWPEWLMTQLNIPVGEQMIWPRYAGGLWVMLTVFYAPMVLDLDRFRILAWLHVIPARSFGTMFFLFAVVIYGAPAGFLVGAFIDGSITILSLSCLIKVVGLEQAIATGRADT